MTDWANVQTSRQKTPQEIREEKILLAVAAIFGTVVISACMAVGILFFSLINVRAMVTVEVVATLSVSVLALKVTDDGIVGLGLLLLLGALVTNILVWCREIFRSVLSPAAAVIDPYLWALWAWV